jgi:hypothetical protein
MKRFVAPVSLLAVIAVTAAYIGTAAGSTTKSVSFTAKYKGKVTEVVNGSNVTGTPKGTGTATLIGKGSITGKVAGNTSQQCSPLSGPGVLKGKKGTLKIKLINSPAPSRACAAAEDDKNNISFSGTAKVTGGTGALKKASGKLHFSGHYDRGTGAFNVKLTGTLKH